MSNLIILSTLVFAGVLITSFGLQEQLVVFYDAVRGVGEAAESSYMSDMLVASTPTVAIWGISVSAC